MADSTGGSSVTTTDKSSSVPTDRKRWRKGGRGGLIAPQWLKGQSGNPSGKRKDGSPPVRTESKGLKATLIAMLEIPEKTYALAESWLQAAIDGDAMAREQILKRVWPVDGTPSAGRVVFEGIRLEVPGTSAPVVLTMGRAEGEIPPSEEDLAQLGPNGPAPCDAIEHTQESQMGSQPTETA